VSLTLNRNPRMQAEEVRTRQRADVRRKRREAATKKAAQPKKKHAPDVD
jgi:hypothetical protein